MGKPLHVWGTCKEKAIIFPYLWNVIRECDFLYMSLDTYKEIRESFTRYPDVAAKSLTLSS